MGLEKLGLRKGQKVRLVKGGTLPLYGFSDGEIVTVSSVSASDSNRIMVISSKSTRHYGYTGIDNIITGDYADTDSQEEPAENEELTETELTSKDVIGKRVRHKEYGFEGVVTEVTKHSLIKDAVTVVVTKGCAPMGSTEWSTMPKNLELLSEDIKPAKPLFAIGDLVTVKEEHSDKYMITTAEMTEAEVVGYTSFGEVIIKLREHKDPDKFRHYAGHEFKVVEETLIKLEDVHGYKVGDKVQVTRDNPLLSDTKKGVTYMVETVRGNILELKVGQFSSGWVDVADVIRAPKYERITTLEAIENLSLGGEIYYSDVLGEYLPFGVFTDFYSMGVEDVYDLIKVNFYKKEEA